MFSPSSFKFFSSLAQPLRLILPGCLNNSWWCFSLSFSSFEDRRRISPKSCPFSWRFLVLALCHPHNCFDCHNSFITIRSISWVVSISFLRRPSCHNSSFSACSYCSPNLTGGSFKYSYGGSFNIPLPLLLYQFIHCFQIPPVVPSITSQVCAISLSLIIFNENK